jgi:uncharacterized protein YjbI with pentapeptide repeats
MGCLKATVKRTGGVELTARRSGRTAGIWVAVAWLGAVLIAAGLLLSAPSWWEQVLAGVRRGLEAEYRTSVALVVVGLGCLVAYRLRRAAKPSAGRLSLFEHVMLLLGLAAGFAVALALLLWWALSRPELTIGQSWTTADTFDAVKIVLLVVAGIGGVVALTVSYRKQRLGESAEYREATRLFAERYNRAAELLGSNDAAARTAGTYAIAGLADDWAQGRQMCIDVLCACRRMPDWPPIVDRIIAAHLQPGAEPSWQGYSFDLSGVNAGLEGIEVATGTTLVLASGRLSRARFSGGTVAFMNVGGAVDFDYATFSGGRVAFNNAKITMRCVSFRNAAFSGAVVSLYGATVECFSEVYCGELDFSYAKFSGGHVDLSKVSITDGVIDFEGAEFSGGSVGFAGANLSGGKINFARATFSAGEVGFRWANLSGTEISFAGANFRGGTVDLSRPAAWSREPDGLSGTEPGVSLPPAERTTQRESPST